MQLQVSTLRLDTVVKLFLRLHVCGAWLLPASSAKVYFGCVNIIIPRGEPVEQDRKPVHATVFQPLYSIMHINIQLAKAGHMA